MELTESRRLTGANLLMDGPGAAAELAVSDADKPTAVSAWRSHIRIILDAVGWSKEQDYIRIYDGGVTLAISAPIDALYAATDLVEAAWDLAATQVRGQLPKRTDNLFEKLNNAIHEERDPNLIELANAAKSHNLTFLSDDETVSLGLGSCGQSWPQSDIPASDEVNWGQLNDIPVALVTGTNGKSTTVRIAASIGAAAGRTVGMSSSDWVRAGKVVIAEGDYSGPEGARLALRDKRVDMAMIETARGGLLRRGLPISNAQACLITNIASDHLGDYGIKDVSSLADVKFTVSKAVESGGMLILNADDPYLVERARNFKGLISWYGLSIDDQKCKKLKTSGNLVTFIKDGKFVLARDQQVIPILPVNDFTPGLFGAARYNISNALGAVALTSALGIAAEAIGKGLAEFESTPEDNPGRGNFMEIGGVNILVDFAHNPHGIRALANAMQSVPATRRLYLLGQAGDRSDEDIRDMTIAVTDSGPDLVIVKELMEYLRGRPAGEIPALIRDELKKQKYPVSQTRNAKSEIEAARLALEWAKPGDLLVFLVYQDRNAVLELLQELQKRNWHPGQPLV